MEQKEAVEQIGRLLAMHEQNARVAAEAATAVRLSREEAAATAEWGEPVRRCTNNKRHPAFSPRAATERWGAGGWATCPTCGGPSRPIARWEPPVA